MFYEKQAVKTKYQNMKGGRVTKCYFLFTDFTGNYSSLIAKFIFQRRMGFYLIQVYLPSLIITILSWLSFYIDPRDIGERVSLGMFVIFYETYSFQQFLVFMFCVLLVICKF